MIDSVVNSLEASSLNLNGIVLLLLGIKIVSYRRVFHLGAFLSFLAYAVQVFFLKIVDFINLSIFIVDVLVGVIVLLFYINKNNLKTGGESAFNSSKNDSNENDI